LYNVRLLCGKMTYEYCTYAGDVTSSIGIGKPVAYNMRCRAPAWYRIGLAVVDTVVHILHLLLLIMHRICPNFWFVFEVRR